MAPAAAAAPSAAATTTWSSSGRAARPAPTASSQSSSRRSVPSLLLFFSLAALLILSSGDDAAAYEAATSERPLKDVSLENPEVTFAPSSMGGKFCERIRVSGIPRWRLQSYANQIHVRMNVSHSMPEKFHWKVGICFHGNVSTGLCECEMGEWQVLQDGMWNSVKSPYGSKYVDVKLADKKSTAFSLSIQEELQKWRLACLGIGFVLLFISPIVSKWAPFYYSSSMALGILLVVLIVLFQGMKLLPMGKKSFLYLTIYGSVLGVGSYAVHYFSTLVASILENFGLSEEMHNPVSIFLLVAIVLTGAGFGYWMVRRFIISKDGSVDAGIAQFVKWAMRVVAIFFVMQSTLDPILASVALAASWWICSVLTANKVYKTMAPKQKQSKVSSHPRFTQVSPNTRQVQFLSPSSRPKAGIGRVTSNSSSTQYGWNNLSNGAFCYAKLASRCPSAGSAYHYTYVCIGEGVAWLIGWALVLEYTIGGSAVARGISPNLALFFGGPDSLPWILARHQLPWFDVIVDPCAAALVLVVTVLLCLGIKESSFVQGFVTSLNACVMLFVIVAGCYIGFQIGWDGYKVTDGYFPYGVNGVLAGSATVFFAYIGFDTVASTAEEVKNPQRDLPLGIGAALCICCMLYMMVSIVIVGIVPYSAMDPDTPISSAFAKHGMQWAMYVVTSGAVLALCSTLMGSLLPQVSIGTLLAFTIVAVSILILRYVPPDEVPLPSSLRESSRLNQEYDEENGRDPLGDEIYNTSQIKDLIVIEPLKDPLLEKKQYTGMMDEMKRRKLAAFSIGSVCLGVLVLTSSASATWLPFLPLCIGCIIGGLLLIAGLGVLCWIDQDDGRHSFGHSGGFRCPFVPFLPVLCILVNTYLLINLGGEAWIRVSIWLLIGVLAYIFYGRTRSSLINVVYVPVAQVDDCSSPGFVS